MNNNWNYRSNNTKSIKRGGFKKNKTKKKKAFGLFASRISKRKVWYLCVICMCLHVCVCCYAMRQKGNIEVWDGGDITGPFPSGR